MQFSIRKRIYLSFFVIVSLFIINGIITILIINNNKKSSQHISEVIDPSLQAIDEFRSMMIESKMYTSNWVFLRAKEDDKKALRKLHSVDYPVLKSRMNNLASTWHDSFMADSLHNVIAGFDNLLVVEKKIMGTLATFDDYDDMMKKFGSKEMVEDEVIPLTANLTTSLNYIITYEQMIRKLENENVVSSSNRLKTLIVFLAFLISVLGAFLAVYMTRMLIVPINKIRLMVNDLGKGMIKKLDHRKSKDEIAEMVQSVNNLSEKLAAAASFAKRVGNRDFDAPFEALSEHDVLGKSIITMRDNLKKSENELLEAEQVLKENNEELKKSNMELDKFVYSVSHDLRAPLSSMLGVVAISEEETQDELQLHHLKMLKGNINKLDGFISDILDYSRNARMELKKEEIDFKEMLADISNNLKYMSGSGRKVEIKTNIINEMPFQTDKSRLNIVLSNLVSNAIRYGNPAEEVALVDITVDLSDTEADIIVRDNGIGISKEHTEKIFDMFYRISKKSNGSGLGLYIVKEAVEKMNGSIEVESELGKGTAFHIHIPNN